MQLNSANGSFADPDDLFARFDPRVIADWASQNGARIGGAANGTVNTALVGASAVVTTALSSASGYVETIAAQGGKYAPSDLTAISITTTNAAELLKDIVCAIAAKKIGRHRCSKDPAVMDALTEAMEWLKQLSEGVAIFPTTEAVESSYTQSEQMTPAEVDQRWNMARQYEPLLGVTSDRSINPFE